MNMTLRITTSSCHFGLERTILSFANRSTKSFVLTDAFSAAKLIEPMQTSAHKPSSFHMMNSPEDLKVKYQGIWVDQRGAAHQFAEVIG